MRQVLTEKEIENINECCQLLNSKTQQNETKFTALLLLSKIITSENAVHHTMSSLTIVAWTFIKKLLNSNTQLKNTALLFIQCFTTGFLEYQNEQKQLLVGLAPTLIKKLGEDCINDSQSIIIMDILLMFIQNSEFIKSESLVPLIKFMITQNASQDCNVELKEKSITTVLSFMDKHQTIEGTLLNQILPLLAQSFYNAQSSFKFDLVRILVNLLSISLEVNSIDPTSSSSIAWSTLTKKALKEVFTNKLNSQHRDLSLALVSILIRIFGPSYIFTQREDFETEKLSNQKFSLLILHITCAELRVLLDQAAAPSTTDIENDFKGVKINEDEKIKKVLEEQPEEKVEQQEDELFQGPIQNAFQTPLFNRTDHLIPITLEIIQSVFSLPEEDSFMDFLYRIKTPLTETFKAVYSFIYDRFNKDDFDTHVFVFCCKSYASFLLEIFDVEGKIEDNVIEFVRICAFLCDKGTKTLPIHPLEFLSPLLYSMIISSPPLLSTFINNNGFESILTYIIQSPISNTKISDLYIIGSLSKILTLNYYLLQNYLYDLPSQQDEISVHVSKVDRSMWSSLVSKMVTINMLEEEGIVILALASRELVCVHEQSEVEDAIDLVSEFVEDYFVRFSDEKDGGDGEEELEVWDMLVGVLQSIYDHECKSPSTMQKINEIQSKWTKKWEKVLFGNKAFQEVGEDDEFIVGRFQSLFSQ